MKGRILILAGTLVLCLGLVSTPASWAATITFQGLDFIFTDLGGTLQLQINNVDDASGNWVGIDTLETFSLKNYGTATFDLAGWQELTNELNADGCTGGSSGGTCFDHGAVGLSDGFALADNNTFNIGYTGTLDLTDTHLKVRFGGAEQGDGHGDLLSQSVPVPGTFLSFALGMAGLLGWQYRSRSKGVAENRSL